ncbi:MAG: PAS domain S-box protein [Candidatus Aminicenantes bacterium]|nr:PAS domain S-box protein [Candidatus Aminicenantes bacterium]
MIKKDGKDNTGHKPLEKTIKILEDRFNESQRIAKIGSWELDLISNTLYWSDEVYRMFGLKPQQFGATYEAFLDNIHPDDRDFVNAAYNESLRTKKPYNIVHRLQLKDGTIKYVNESCKTFFDDKGNAIRSIGTVQDITEQKQTEEELHWAKELTEKALNAQHDTFFIFEINTGKAVLWNRAFREISGYTDDEIARMSAPGSYYGPKDLELAVDYTKKILGEWEGIVQLELICKNGNKVPTEYRASVINDNNGNPKYIISIGRDITERIRAEEDLKKQKEFSQKIINTSNAIIVGLDKDHKIKLFNEGAERITGFKSEEVLGRDWFELFVKAEMIGEINEVWENAWGMKYHSFINPILIKNGDSRIISWQNTGIYEGNEENHLLISIGEDITERKKAEEEIFKLKDGLEVKVAEKTKELKEKVTDLQRFFDAAVDRELRMKELYDENEKLKADLEEKG